VLEGEITFWVDMSGKPFQRARPGSLVFVPRGTSHSFRVDSPTARWLSVSTPAGHERFYRAGGEPATAGNPPPTQEPDMTKVEAAARRHGVELLGHSPASEQHDEQV
jgi:hypothetical protein